MCRKCKEQIVHFSFSSSTLHGCYLHSEDHAQYELFYTAVCSREIIYMFLVGQVSGLVENFKDWDFPIHHICDKCQTLLDDFTH